MDRVRVYNTSGVANRESLFGAANRVPLFGAANSVPFTRKLVKGGEAVDNLSCALLVGLQLDSSDLFILLTGPVSALSKIVIYS
ncbi:hypothetical protein Gotur_005956 [Gossypium turneri]